MTPNKRLRLPRVFSRKNVRRLAILMVLLLLAGWAGRNSMARYAAIRIGSTVLSTRIEVGSVNIQWGEISVTDIELYEPNIENAKQLSVKQVRVVPSLWQGLRTGVWLSEVEIHSPVAEVRFDETGKLLSVFPETGEETESTGPITIPLSKLSVVDAELSVHQIGKESLQVKDVDLEMLAADRIKVAISIPDLVGIRCNVKCDLDAESFEGRSSVTIDHVHLDSTQLAQLPLVPAAIASEPFSIDGGLKLVVLHPANELDPRKHSVKLHAWTSNAQVDRLGMLCKRLDMVVMNDNGRLKATVTANPLEGDLKLFSSVDLMAKTPELVVESTLVGCQPSALSKNIPELKKLQTNTIATTKWKLVLDDDQLRFHGDASADVTATSFASFSLPVVKARVNVSGSFPVSDPGAFNGEIRGDIASEVFDLAALARSLGFEAVSGDVIARGEFSVPLQSIANIATYSASANVNTSSIATSEFRVDDALLTAELVDGVASIDLDPFVVRDSQENLLAELRSSTTASLLDEGILESTSHLFAEPSLEIARLLGVATFDPGGRLLADITATCPVNSVASPDKWSAKTRVRTQALSALGETISNIDWRATLANGKINCSPLEASWRGHRLMAHASASIGPQVVVQGDVSLDSLRLAELSEVLSRYSSTRLPADGLASVQGSFSFDTDPATGNQAFNASGSARLSKASYARTRIGEANLQWSADLHGLSLTTSSPDFLGGRFDITARMKELDWTRTQIEGNFAGVEAARLIGIAGQTIPATGTFDGGFRMTSIASCESLTGDAWIASKQLSVKRLPLQIDQANLVMNQGEISIDAAGSAVDGNFIVQAGGSLPQVVEFLERKSAPIAEIPFFGDVKLTGLRTESLVRPLGLPREAQAVSARLSADCSRSLAAADGRHLCVASATIEDLRYNHQGLSRRMSIETVLHANRLEVLGIRGRFADGALAGTGELNFERSPTGRFDLSASHVNLRRATSPLGINDIAGTGTLRVRGRIGSVISGQFDASVDNLTAAGVAIRKAKFPVDWSFRPSGNLARWQCRAGTVSVGGGNVRIASEGSYGSGLSATTSVRIEKIDLAKLMQNGSAGSGTLSGNAIVRAKNARGVNDLVGTFAMEMQNIQAMKIPVLDQLPKMITLTPPVPGRGKDGGTVRGRLAGGLVHLDEVAIYQSNVQVMVTGNATMTGKLNLDVVASTESTSPTDQLVSLLDSPVMLAAPAPVALIVKANELLKDRVVRVHVGGTADRPTLRLQPVKQLSQDAVKFFLSSSLGPMADRLTETQSNNRRRY